MHTRVLEGLVTLTCVREKAR